MRVAQKYIRYTSVSNELVDPVPDGLVRLCHHRWTIPLLAALGASGGARFAVLQRQLDVARETLRRALDAALELDVVAPNPGRGHPLRAEYLLTPAGRRLAPGCRAVTTASAATPDGPALAARKWTLPVLVEVHGGAGRFSEIEAALPTATPRALSHALDDLVDAGWLEREWDDERRPRPRYAITRRSRRLARAASRLAAAASA